MRDQTRLTDDQRRWFKHERQLCKSDSEWRRQLGLRYAPHEVRFILECLAAADEEAE